MGYNFTTARCEPTPDAFLKSGREVFRKILGIFVVFHKITVADFRVNQNIFDRISNRIYQRLNYYQFFHNKQLSQTRQAGLKAYWILRYRPIKLVSPGSWKKAYDVNVYFAFYAIVCDVFGECFGNLRDDVKTLIISEILKNYENTFIRPFSEYDISKESMMLVADDIKKMCLYEIKLRIQR